MFRFTIRELVLLTLVVAMGGAWWRDHRAQQSLNHQFEMERWKARANALRQHVEDNGETVSWHRSELGDAEEIAIGSGGTYRVYSPSLVGDNQAPLSLRPWESAAKK